MNTLIAAENIGHAYHDEWLFRNLTIGIQGGQRIALVGVNGAGKSTLLKLLACEFPAIEGKIVKNKTVSIGFLDQNPVFPDGYSISDFIFSLENKQQQLIRRYEELLEQNDPDQTELGKMFEELSAHNVWEYEHNIKSILGRMGIFRLGQKISTLSGGQKKRIALAKLLIEDPDVYILDEPTNHLDIETIEWLEKLLAGGNKTMLLVTHDRYFLDNVCTSIIELNQGTVYTYSGNYADFLDKKYEREQNDETVYQKNKNLLKKELEWMRRMPQARGTKSQARIDSFYDLENKTKRHTDNKSLSLNIKMARQGGKILELDSVHFAFDHKEIIKSFSYTFKKGDRIGLAGKNGSGKSTLLNLMTGNLFPDRGSVDAGETTKFGYYTQQGLAFNENDRVLDVVKSEAEYIKMADGSTISASQLLTIFLFPPKKQHGFVSKLSGGEKKRLHLMKVLLQNPNFLILDEPTNDLDIDTLNVLEEFLENFPGVLVLVSHDRYLLDKMCDQLIVMEDAAQVIIFSGNYSEYREQQTKPKEKATVKNIPVVEEKKASSKKLTFKEQQEYNEIESEILLLEMRIKEFSESISSLNPAAYEEVQRIAEQIEQDNDKLERLTERWMNLSMQQEN